MIQHDQEAPTEEADHQEINTTENADRIEEVVAIDHQGHLMNENTIETDVKEITKNHMQPAVHHVAVKTTVPVLDLQLKKNIIVVPVKRKINSVPAFLNKASVQKVNPASMNILVLLLQSTMIVLLLLPHMIMKIFKLLLLVMAQRMM